MSFQKTLKVNGGMSLRPTISTIFVQHDMPKQRVCADLEQPREVEHALRKAPSRPQQAIAILEVNEDELRMRKEFGVNSSTLVQLPASSSDSLVAG